MFPLRHSAFSQGPSVPVAFLIHDRKFPKVHELFAKTLSELIPNLSKR